MLEIDVVRARILALIFGPAALVALALACLPDLVAVQQANSCGNGIVDLALGEECDPGGQDASGCTPPTRTSGCSMDCDGGALDPKTNHCYFWTDPADSIDQAILSCDRAGGHLVSFADVEELQAVISQTKSLANAPDASGGLWTALEKGLLNDAGVQTYYIPPGIPIDVPAWAATCPGCFAIENGGDADFPLAGQNPQLCVFWKRSTNSSWVQQTCTFTNGTNVPVLCEREPIGAFSQPCSDASTSDTCIVVPRTSGNKRYELTRDVFTFDGARAHCASRGGMLVKFDSGGEREEVIAEVARVLGPGGDVWIGLVHDDDAGAWKWLDDATAPPVFPTPWADLEPSVNTGAATIHLELGAYDTRLAHAQADTTGTHPAICQLPW